MKATSALFSAVLIVIHAGATIVHGQSAFTYQGRLQSSAANVTGLYDFQFSIYNSQNGGSAVAGPRTNAATSVSNGLFTVTLDFGAGIFTGADRWLDISVRTNGAGAFTNLSPRQQLTAGPYAIAAGHLTGIVPASGLSGPYSGAVTFNNPTNAFNGSGAGLTGLNASQLTSGTVPAAALGNAWRIGGNAGTTPGTQFLGTTDNQPLEIKVNGMRALRLEDNGDGSDQGLLRDGAPNIIGGAPNNFVAPGVVGATISGGGATNYDGIAYPNRVEADFATIGGGPGNQIRTAAIVSTIAGGFWNDIGTNSVASAIGGGYDNNIAANSPFAAIAGGFWNDIAANSDYGAIGGGSDNDIGTNSDLGVISGGNNNNIAANSPYATIAGGSLNDISLNAPSSLTFAFEASEIQNCQ